MTRTYRPRHLSAIALTAVFALLLASCSGQYPNSTFTNHTDFNRDAGGLWNLMIWLGIGVFVFVEGLLVYVMVKYRRTPNSPEPEHVHGNTKLELTWTVLPAVVLVIIAVPTVKSIWKFQSGAPANALQVDVIGHQWWWEFRYPEQNVVTANELYIPTGRPVNFTLRSVDVIHSFWIPQLGGKRDVVSNRTNHLWYTPDSVGTQAFNGSCNEYCGASHANMRFRAYTVSPEEFDRWVAGQQGTAIFPGSSSPAGDACSRQHSRGHAGRRAGCGRTGGCGLGVPEGEPAVARDPENAASGRTHHSPTTCWRAAMHNADSRSTAAAPASVATGSAATRPPWAPSDLT